LTHGERGFLAWSGLKGAVPILLAAFALLDGVPRAEAVYGIVFVAVLVSVFGQGSLVPAVARRLLRAGSSPVS
jgi:cell volume regulation protein A